MFSPLLLKERFEFWWQKEEAAVLILGRAAVEPCCPFFKIDPILCERGPHCIYANLAGLTLAGRKLSVTQVKPTI